MTTTASANIIVHASNNCQDNDVGELMDSELSSDEQEHEHESKATGPGAVGASSLSLSASANNKGAHFGKLVGKKAARLKELVLQNLGKADRTRDELFDLYELNFHKQQQQVSKLTKEFRAYVGALKHFHEASKSLNKCIQQSTSDYQPARHDLVCESLAQMEVLNEDQLEKLSDQVVKQVGEYLAKFGEMKDKISKRHRKLIDYDKSRRLYELTLAQVNKRRAKQQQQQQQQHQQQDPQQHNDNYHSILRGIKFLSHQQEQQQHQHQQQQSTIMSSQQEFIASQLVDEARLLKFREEFNYCKLMFESINGELHDELPIVYEKKMKSLLTALQNYYALEAHYHLHAGKLLGSVSEVIDEMPSGAGSLQQRALAARKLRDQRDDNNNNDNSNDNCYEVDDDGQCQTIVQQTISGDNSGSDADDGQDDDDDSYESSSSCGSSSAANGAAGVGVAADVKSKSKAGVEGGRGSGSSGVGSSRGESSCSVGSSSPDCPRGADSATPNDEQEAEATQQRADDDRSGKAGGVGSADCSSPVAAAGLAQSSPSAEPLRSAQGKASATVGGTIEARAPTEQPPAPPLLLIAKVDNYLNPADQPDVGARVAAETPVTGRGDDVAMGGNGVDSPLPAVSASTVGMQFENVPTGDAAASGSGQPLASSSLLASSDSALYRVKTNYQYLAEDVDELCFEANEIIQVVEFDESQEPEEGWLMGVREINGQRGLFPANFTAPI